MEWKSLCGLAVQLCKTQAVFRKEANILKRLHTKYGPDETEHMLRGAILCGWSSLVSLASADGLGRRMALARYWQSENQRPAKYPERLKKLIWDAIA